MHDDELRELLRSPSLDGVGVEGGARQALATGRALTGIELTGAGRAWVGSWYPLERAGRRLVATVAVDVTEHDAAEARLRASRERLDRAQELAGLGSYALGRAPQRLDLVRASCSASPGSTRRRPAGLGGVAGDRRARAPAGAARGGARPRSATAGRSTCTSASAGRTPASGSCARAAGRCTARAAC